MDHFLLNQFITEDIYLIDSADAKSEHVSNVDTKYLIMTPIPLPDKDKEFLYKIFAAVDVSPDMLELGGPETNVSDGHARIFFFGVKPESGPVEFYKEFSFQDGTAIVAHSLSEIANETAKKRELWSVLQTCFT